MRWKCKSCNAFIKEPGKNGPRYVVKYSVIARHLLSCYEVHHHTASNSESASFLASETNEHPTSADLNNSLVSSSLYTIQIHNKKLE